MKKNKDFDSFLHLSAEMTGYSRTDLMGTGVAYLYYTTFTEIVDNSICQELWSKSNRIWKAHKSDAKKEEAIRKALLSHPKYGPLLRSLIKLWYLVNGMNYHRHGGKNMEIH